METAALTLPLQAMTLSADFCFIMDRIALDKKMNCHCTAASLTVAVSSHGVVVLYTNQPSADASYDISGHLLIDLSLPFANSGHYLGGICLCKANASQSILLLRCHRRSKAALVINAWY